MTYQQIRDQVKAAIANYLRGQHDVDKRALATQCQTAVDQATSVQSLLDILIQSQTRVKDLVARKNRARIFNHRPGNLNIALLRGIAECRFALQSDAGQSLEARQHSTVGDWNRPGEGHDGIVVNGQAWRNLNPTLGTVSAFLMANRIPTQALRDFIRDNSNQASLWGMNVLFIQAFAEKCMQTNHQGLLSCNLHDHKYTTKGNDKVLTEDTWYFNMLDSENGPVVLRPPVVLKAKYTLADDHGTVQLESITFTLDNSKSLPQALRKPATDAVAAIQF